MAFELPDRGLVFWPVGNGDSTTIVIDSKTYLQVDLNHLDKSDDDEDASWAVVDELSERLRYQGGNEDLLDIGKEGDPIHRPVQEHRRGQAIPA